MFIKLADTKWRPSSLCLCCEVCRDKVKLQKKGMMEDLLTGRVRVEAAQEVGS